MQHISPTQLAERLAQQGPKPLLLDVREPWETDICKLPDSVLIPMGQVSERYPEIAKDQDIVVICHHGVRSMHIAMYLERVGYSRVFNLSGGINAWAMQLDKDMALY